MQEGEDGSIQTLQWKDKEWFGTECIENGKPVKLQNVRGNGWKLSHCIEPNHLKNKTSTVWVSHGNEETGSPTKKTKMKLNDYVSRLSSSSLNIGYLKQQESSEILDDDFPIKPHSIVPKEYWCTSYFWMGPSGSKTGLHNDDEHSFLLQIYGTKQVKLLHPKYSKYCYANKKYDSGTTCYDFDPYDPDYSNHDNAKDISRYFIDVSLSPGEALLIPKNWLHCTTATSISISLNIFISTFSEQIFEGIPRRIFDYLHGFGIYKPGHCVCHTTEG